MEIDKARVMIDAMARIRHARMDFRTEEARKYTAWMDEHLASYISKDARLLDIGCGSGKMTFKAEELGAEATGIDCSLEAIRFAREIAQDTDRRSLFIQADYTRMPLREGSFDLAIFVKNIVECGYGEAAGIARTLRRILRSSGRFILTMRDGLDKAILKGGDPHERSTGQHLGQINVPGSGQFEYPSYFWTVAFVIHVVGEYLPMESSKSMNEKDHLLVFRRP